MAQQVSEGLKKEMLRQLAIALHNIAPVIDVLAILFSEFLLRNRLF